ncbi:MAG: methionyl-tRNA formyltransferase [Oscillospiraceae bacterium]
MKIVFMGTPEFSVPCLQRLIDEKYDVVGVFTQPDKPKGRGYELSPPAVKVCALANDIAVFQPKSMKDGEALKILKELEPELIVVIAYGKILPADILYFPKYGSINIHASLLPKYRGAAPIQWAVINGEQKSGVTSMQMNEGIDTGDMLLKAEIPIDINMTAGELHDALSKIGADVMQDTIKAIIENRLNPIKQNDNISTYSPMLSKELCPIDFNKSALEIHNKVRGLSPWPVATATLDGKKVKIHKTGLSKIITEKSAGTIISNDDKLTVACGDKKCVDILELQLEGKKRMNVKDFLLGHKISLDTKFN